MGLRVVTKYLDSAAAFGTILNPCWSNSHRWLLCLGPEIIPRVTSKRTFKCLAVIINHQSVLEPFPCLQPFRAASPCCSVGNTRSPASLFKSLCCQSFSFKHKICFVFCFGSNMWGTGFNSVWLKCKLRTAHQYSNMTFFPWIVLLLCCFGVVVFFLPTITSLLLFWCNSSDWGLGWFSDCAS